MRVASTVRSGREVPESCSRSMWSARAATATTSTTWSPAGPRATLVAGEEPGAWSGAGAAALGRGRGGGVPGLRRGARGPRPGLGRGAAHAGGAPERGRLRPHLLRTQVGEPAPPAGPGGDRRPRSGAGHQAAVAEAAGYLERAAVGVRRTRAGQVTSLPSTGVVAGQFLHRTSRALDPHLHTHLVVANVAQGVDGRWSAVDSRRLFAHAPCGRGHLPRPAPARAQRPPRRRLGRAPVGSGRRGRRRRHAAPALLPALRGHRRVPWSDRAGARRRAGSIGGAFHATRPDKDRTCTVDSLMAEWKQRAADFGFDLGDLTRVVGPRRELPARPRSTPTGCSDRLGRAGRPAPHGRPSGPGGGGRRRLPSGASRPSRRVGGRPLVAEAGRSARVRSGPEAWPGPDRVAGRPAREPRWRGRGRGPGRGAGGRAALARTAPEAERAGRGPTDRCRTSGVGARVGTGAGPAARAGRRCAAGRSSWIGDRRHRSALDAEARSGVEIGRPAVGPAGGRGAVERRAGAATVRRRGRGPAGSTPVGCARRRPARDRAPRG